MRNYENKRVEQHINYDNWLREKADLMETFKNRQNKNCFTQLFKIKDHLSTIII